MWRTMKTKTYKNKTLCAGRVCRNIHTGMIPLKRIITSFHKRVKRSRAVSFKRFYRTTNIILGNIVIKGRSAHTIHSRLKNDTIQELPKDQIKHAKHHGIEADYMVQVRGDNDNNAYKAFFSETQSRALSFDGKIFYTQEIEDNTMSNGNIQNIVVDKVDLVSDSVLARDIDVDNNFSVNSIQNVSTVVNNYHNNNPEKYVTFVRNYHKVDYVVKNKIYFNDDEKTITIDLNDQKNLNENDDVVLQTSITNSDKLNN
jgi:hypothetical protein